MPRVKTIFDVFWEKVEVPEDPDACWNWLGATRQCGYGAICRQGKNLDAHRVSWTIHHGDPPKDKPWILHTCDNRLCCNPKHLYAGTARENARDRIQRGRTSINQTRRVGVNELEEIGLAEGTRIQVAERFNVSLATVQKARKFVGKTGQPGSRNAKENRRTDRPVDDLPLFGGGE